MSGHHSNLIADTCFLVQQANDSTKLFNNRDFQKYAYENVTEFYDKDNNIKCGQCINDSSTCVPNTLDSLKYRVNIENDLIGIDRLTTKCDSNKFKPCYANNCVSNSNNCSYLRTVAQPLLCDRTIVKTNMKPFSSGLLFNPDNK